MRELDELLRALTQRGALGGLAALLLCLVAAWGLARLLRGRNRANDSIWFGHRLVDGVLFPVIALALAYAASIALHGSIEVVVFRLALPVLAALVLLRLVVHVLAAALPSAFWVRSAERVVWWLAWLGVALWVTGLLPLLLGVLNDIGWKMGNQRFTLRNVLEGTLTAAVVLVLALWVSSAIEKRLLRGTGDDLSIRMMTANIVRALLLFVGLLFALSAVGIDLSALSVIGGALGVGVGFGLRNIAANYVSGFAILAERSLRIGDMVKVDDFEGRITDIRTRFTLIRALNGREAIVPNEMLVTQRVENLSLADPRVAVSTKVQVGYGSDVRALQTKLAAAMLQVPRVLQTPAPGVQLSAFAADGIELTLNFWIRDSENGQGNVKSDVHLAVLDVLNAEHIDIPYPQRVVRTLDVLTEAPPAGR